MIYASLGVKPRKIDECDASCFELGCSQCQEGKEQLPTSPTVGSWSPSPTMRMQSAWRMQRWVQGVRVLSAWYSTILWMSSCWPSQLVSLYSWMLGTDKENREFNWCYITASMRREGISHREKVTFPAQPGSAPSSCWLCLSRIYPKAGGYSMLHISNASIAPLSMNILREIQLFQLHK